MCEHSFKVAVARTTALCASLRFSVLTRRQELIWKSPLDHSIKGLRRDYGDVELALAVVQRQHRLAPQLGPLQVDLSEVSSDVFVVEALASQKLESVVDDSASKKLSL
jgi:hypothetical protein